ncbi:hypothetical protein V2J09_012930 [Rumex salicifolius]
MSTPQPSLSIPDKARRKSSHRRTDSGELDVFEAERYFSTATEHLSQATTTTITFPQRIGTMKSANPRPSGRASLDMPRLLLNPQQNILLPQNKEKKKHNQPNSPGGKLASFFNSLINQAVSKKKKPSKSPNDNTEQESLGGDDGWRTRRRNSITTTKPTAISDIDAKSIRSSSSLVSGFRTPPPYMINTPIKPYKKHTNSTSQTTNPNWFREEFKFVNGLSSSSAKDLGYFEKKAEVDGGSFKGFMEEEDGDDSDSSSDLFELQLNYDDHHHHHNLHHKLGYCATDLPVYETTHLDTIKISSSNPITINGRFRN